MLNIDIKYYKLKLEVDPAINFIKGRNVIYFKTANPTNQIQLNLRDELLITSVSKLPQHTSRYRALAKCICDKF